MSAHRFFLAGPMPQASGEVLLPLSTADVHHAVAVLRIGPGELIEVVDPTAHAGWIVRVDSATRDGVSGEITGALEMVSPLHVTLVQGVAKGEKMDTIIRQAVEIGAAEIVPALTSRTVVRLEAQKRASRGDRWRRVAKGAAEQSRRASVPTVHDPAPLSEVLGLLDDYDVIFVLWEDAADQPGLSSALTSLGRDFSGRLALVIGPEGGLSEDEAAVLAGVGGTPVTLGSGILRTETAAVTALAITMDRLGGLGTSRG